MVTRVYTTNSTDRIDGACTCANALGMAMESNFEFVHDLGGMRGENR